MFSFCLHASPEALVALGSTVANNPLIQSRAPTHPTKSCMLLLYVVFIMQKTEGLVLKDIDCDCLIGL